MSERRMKACKFGPMCEAEHCLHREEHDKKHGCGIACMMYGQVFRCVPVDLSEAGGLLSLAASNIMHVARLLRRGDLRDCDIAWITDAQAQLAAAREKIEQEIGKGVKP